MPYNQHWAASNPGCLIFLIDRSGSMRATCAGKSLATGESLKDQVAAVVNNTIRKLADSSRKGTEIRPRVEVSIIGYGGNSVVSALPPSLAGQEIVSIADLYANPIRVETKIKSFYHLEADETEVIEIASPIWVEPEASGNTPMCAAIQKATAIAQAWTIQHPSSYPPVVINITDGMATDGDSRAPAEALKEIATSDGNALLFNCHISAAASGEVLYPGDPSQLPPDHNAAVLFSMSSELPESMRSLAAQTVKPGINAKSRGFVFNADISDVVNLVTVATVPATDGQRDDVPARATSPHAMFVPMPTIGREESSTRSTPICSKCGAENPSSARTCLRCGISLAVAATADSFSARSEARETPHNPLATPVDNVHFSVFAPSIVRPESSFVLTLWAFIEAQRHEMTQQASQSGRRAEVGTVGPARVPRGVMLTVTARLPGFTVARPKTTLLWDGTIASTSFPAFVPRMVQPGTHVCEVVISCCDVPVIQLFFELQIGASDAEPAAIEPDRRRVRSVFASYARDDLLVVGHWARGATTVGVDVFLDVLNLRDGVDWEQELWRQVPAKDLFCLFWSKPASRSTWVKKEWQCALSARGVAYIHPISLVDPRVVPPPPELQEKQFDDVSRIVLEYERLVRGSLMSRIVRMLEW